MDTHRLLPNHSLPISVDNDKANECCFKKQQQQQQQQQHSLMTREGSQENTASPSLNRFTTFFEAKNDLRSSFDFSTHTPSALNTLEMLQSRLKQKDGEVGQLQVNY